MFWKQAKHQRSVWTQGHSIYLARWISTKPPSCYNPWQTNCRDRQLLHLQNWRHFFSIYRRWWCTWSQRRASCIFLNRDIEQNSLSSRLVQGPRSVRWSFWRHPWQRIVQRGNSFACLMIIRVRSICSIVLLYWGVLDCSVCLLWLRRKNNYHQAEPKQFQMAEKWFFSQLSKFL